MTRAGVRVPPVLPCSVSVVVSTCCGRDGGVTRGAMQWSSLGKNTVSSLESAPSDNARKASQVQRRT